jgi:energy coupling factor transporter S component ThiW
MNKIKKLALSGILIALGVSLSTLYIPIGASKCFPIQHFINVISAVILGPFYALANAFIISIIRNSMGLGTLLAFPGSMIGAFIAGIMYKKYLSIKLAAIGEFVGTGIIGGLIASPVAVFLMGKEVGIFFFIIPFIISTSVGSILAFVFLEFTSIKKVIRQKMEIK